VTFWTWIWSETYVNMNTTTELLNTIDTRLRQYRPITVILATLAVLGGVRVLHNIRRSGLQKSVRHLLGVLLRAVRKVPGVSGVVNKKQAAMANDITQLFTKHDQDPGMPARIHALPDKGLQQADIFAMIDVLSKREQEIVKEGTLFTALQCHCSRDCGSAAPVRGTAALFMTCNVALTRDRASQA
jgi:hypothetical protein